MRVSSLFKGSVPDLDRPLTFGEVYRNIAQYYATMRRNPHLYEAFRDKSESGARIIKDFLPFVEEVYGTGYPHYGNVNPLKRFSFQVKELERFDPANSWMTLALLIPDLDYMVVFEAGDMKFTLQPGMHKIFLADLKRRLDEYPLEWEAAVQRLQKHGITEISPDQVVDFLKKRTLHLDLLAVPSHVWQDADCFIHWEEDIPNLAFVRDIGFTCHPLATGRFADIPTRHRVNRLLLVLSNTGKTTVNSLLTTTVASHPYVHIAYLFREAMDSMAALWYMDLMQAQSSNLISIDHREIVSITEEGRNRLNDVLARRRALYRDGF